MLSWFWGIDLGEDLSSVKFRKASASKSPSSIHPMFSSVDAFVECRGGHVVELVLVKWGWCCSLSS